MLASMSQVISNKNESVRMFKSDFLEFFSHMHPLTPVVVFVPAILFSFYQGFQKVSLAEALFSFMLGVILWTLIEYWLHRIVFHHEGKTKIGKFMHFIVHGVHHNYPQDATRLVLPPVASIPLAVFFYFLFNFSLERFGLMVFSGFVSGYLTYDSLHYATHHFKMQNKIGKFLKAYHLRHHFQNDGTGFGVSTPLWDYVFGTAPQTTRNNLIHSK